MIVSFALFLLPIAIAIEHIEPIQCQMNGFDYPARRINNKQDEYYNDSIRNESPVNRRSMISFGVGTTTASMGDNNVHDGEDQENKIKVGEGATRRSFDVAALLSAVVGISSMEENNLSMIAAAANDGSPNESKKSMKVAKQEKAPKLPQQTRYRELPKKSRKKKKEKKNKKEKKVKTKSPSPSAVPSSSSSPSTSPSDNPSNVPSSAPSISTAPSAVPSSSAFPSSNPSDIPSDVPSSPPSISAVPSSAPSESSMPSGIPSKSSIPSVVPSESSFPSNIPSDFPSGVPSKSSFPTSVPSKSSFPSGVPSKSLFPSNKPSKSLFPSSAPSKSLFPSTNPSDTPSDVPSNGPSISSAPSSVPSKSAMPSTIPSLSLFPSNIPSDTPSIAPSNPPSISYVPSSAPSKSSIPSDLPSASFAPSFAPSPICNKGVIITEIMYNPNQGPGNKNQYVEILNYSCNTVDLAGWIFTDNADNDVISPDGGSSSQLLPGEYALILDGDSEVLATFSVAAGTKIFKVNDNGLGNNELTTHREQLSLRDLSGNFVDTVEYSNTRLSGCDTGANGGGYSLERVDPNGPGDCSNFKINNPTGGTPGRENNMWQGSPCNAAVCA